MASITDSRVMNRLRLAASIATSRCAIIWSSTARRASALSSAARATHVILCETHDNPEHHRLQRLALESLPGPRTLAMEQFDSEHQAAIDAAREKKADAEGVADAGRFDRKGWNWPLYRPLVE